MFIKTESGNYLNLTNTDKLVLQEIKSESKPYLVCCSFKGYLETVYSTDDKTLAQYVLDDIVNHFANNYKLYTIPFKNE